MLSKGDKKMNYNFKGENFQTIFEDMVRQYPDNIAISDIDSALTYRELNNKSNKLASYLRAIGIEREKRVAIICDRNINTIVGIVAILKAGGAYVPIDSTLPDERIKFMLTDSSSDVVMYSNKNIKNLELSIKTIDLFDKKYYESENLPYIQYGLNDLALILYTSGTTGNPKGVMVEQNRFLKTKYHYSTRFGIDSSDTVLQFGSLGFAASFEEMTMALLSGAELCMIPREFIFDVCKFENYLVEHKVSVIMVPPQFTLNFSCLNIKTFITASGKVSPTIVEHFSDSTKYYNCYGCSELGVVISWSMKERREYSTIPLGTPFGNIKVYIINNGNLCSVMEKGEICVVGDGMARGYVNLTALTEEKFVKNPFGLGKMYRTGDYGRWLPDGNIEFIGREDDQIEIRGYRIELSEIESILRQQATIKDCAVISKMDSDNEKYICAFVVGDGDLHIDEIKKSLGNLLPDYMIPSYIIKIDKIPINRNGKIDKLKLADFDIMTITLKDVTKTETETIISNAFCRVLHLNDVGIDDNFFDIGGHSLRAVQLLNLIRETIGIHLPISTFFSTPTVRQTAKIIDAYLKGYEEIPEAESKKYYPMSSAQRRIYAVNRIEGNGMTYNVPQVFKLKGDVQVYRFKTALEELIRRHEILRTEFVMHNNEPVQHILNSADVNFQYIEYDERTDTEIIDDFIRPFNLEKAPLFRTEIIKREKEYLLLIDMNHIICDNMSLSIFNQELCALYNGDILEDVRQYKDYSEWMRTRDLSLQQEYWESEFSGDIPVLNMPLDFIRPKEQSFEGSMIRQIVDHELVKKIKHLSKSSGTTTYMILLSAVMITMSKYSYQEDIIIGSPISARLHLDTEKMLGMFSNTLAIRGRPEGKKKYKDFLCEVKDSCLRAYENQEYPFENLIDLLDIKRDISRNPLFDVMFVLQNDENVQSYRFNGIKIETIEMENRGSKFDLTFKIFENCNDMLFTLQYCSSLYFVESARRILNCFIKILEQITSVEEIILEDLELVTDTERKLIFETFNDTTLDFPRDKTVVDLFEEQVKQTPEQVAVLYENTEITYQVLNERANQLAKCLREKGVKPDDIVAILAERSIEMIIGIYGIIKAGGAYAPIDPDYPEDRIEYMLEDCNPKVLIVYKTKLETQIPTIDLADNLFYTSEVDNLEHVNNAVDLLYCIYTSGTTGNPKGVMIEHKGIVSLHEYMKKLYKIDSTDNILQFASYAFDASVWEMTIALLSGARLCVISKECINDISRFNQYIRDNNITLMALPPQYYMQTDVSGLNVLSTGGSESNQEVVRKALVNKRYINQYGPTENTIQATHWEYNYREDLPIRIPIGSPISNTKIYILNGEKLCGIGMPGELCISGEGLARGYLNQPKLTAEKFRRNLYTGERMYRSGDLVRWLPDGNIEFLGRIDEQIKLRGFRVELSEIESKLRKIPDIKDAAVIVREDNSGDKSIYAYIVSDKKIDISEIRDQLNKCLPDYLIPSYMMQINSIPVTQNGKLDKQALPKIEATSENDYVAPRNKIEEDLCSAFEKVLSVRQVGIQDNFFELGGHSLKAIILEAELEKANIEISVEDIYKYATIEKLSQLISNQSGDYINIMVPETKKKMTFHVNKDEKILNAHPFNDILYKGCLYNSLFSLLQYNNIDIYRYMTEDVIVYKYQEESGLIDTEFIENKSLQEMLQEDHIQFITKKFCEDITQEIVHAIDLGNPVIISCDPYYNPGRTDAYQKLHFNHSILVNGYNRRKRIFYILEHKHWENLNYEQNIIPFDVLELCYKKGSDNYNNPFTFLKILEGSSISVDKRCLQQNLLNCVKKYEHVVREGINLLRNFIVDYSKIVRKKDLLNHRMDAYISSFNSIINSKQAEKYRIKYLFGEMSTLWNSIKSITDSYTIVRTYLVRYAFSGIYREDDFNKSIVELEKILEEESKYLVIVQSYQNVSDLSKANDKMNLLF